MSKEYRPRHQPQRRDPNRPIDLLIRQPYYDQIDRGQKTIEGRVAYPFLNRAREGLGLTFKRWQDDSRLIACSIDWVLRSKDFENALLDIEWQKAIPSAQHFDEALTVYERIYPPEKVEEMGGVIFFGFTKQGIRNV